MADVVFLSKTIVASAFSGCSKLQEVILNEGLTKIYIPELVTAIEDDTFLFTNLMKFNLPKNLQRIGSDAFYGCKASSIDIPKTVTSIGERAFANSINLKTVILHEGLKTIDISAFSSCSSLSKIIIPESLTSLASNAFSGNTIILCVYNGSTAHTVAVNNNIPYFLMKKTENPETSYGKGISGTAFYTIGTPAAGATVEILYEDGTVKESVNTDELGNYSFTYAEVGRYTIRVTDTSGNTASEVVSVKRMNVFDVYVSGDTNLILKKGYNVSGTVLPVEAKITLSSPSGISYNAETGKISVTTTEAGTLYIATYEGKTLTDVTLYDIPVGTTEDVCTLTQNQTAFLWNEKLKPLLEKFNIDN